MALQFMPVRKKKYHDGVFGVFDSITFIYKNMPKGLLPLNIEEVKQQQVVPLLIALIFHRNRDLEMF